MYFSDILLFMGNEEKISLLKDYLEYARKEKITKLFVVNTTTRLTVDERNIILNTIRSKYTQKVNETMWHLGNLSIWMGIVFHKREARVCLHKGGDRYTTHVDTVDVVTKEYMVPEPKPDENTAGIVI